MLVVRCLDAGFNTSCSVIPTGFTSVCLWVFTLFPVFLNDCTSLVGVLSNPQFRNLILQLVEIVVSDELSFVIVSTPVDVIYFLQLIF